MAPRELYISVDIEADGPIPGPFSMVSIGACTAAIVDNGSVTRLDPQQQTFYAELKPISDDFDPEALAVSGLTREHLVSAGQRPQDAMPAFDRWVRALADDHDAAPVFAAFPLPFDWLFAYWYLMRFAGRSPFGFSSARDLKTEYAARAGVGIKRAGKRFMPKRLLGHRPHTHNALDDALGQADLCYELLVWDGRR